jgi:hypothetical protein
MTSKRVSLLPKFGDGVLGLCGLRSYSETTDSFGFCCENVENRQQSCHLHDFMKLGSQV